MKKAEINLYNIYQYLIGNIRYRLYHSFFRFLIPKHIIEQYLFRLEKMNKECYNQGECIKCGCKTTELQFANKSCSGNCYPPIMSIKKWEKYKEDNDICLKKK